MRSPWLRGAFVCLAVSFGAFGFSGCGDSYSVSPGTPAGQDMAQLMEKLNNKEPGVQRNAMFWLRKMSAAEAQPALSKVQEIATKAKDPALKADAEETIKHIQGG